VVSDQDVLSVSGRDVFDVGVYPVPLARLAVRLGVANRHGEPVRPLEVPDRIGAIAAMEFVRPVGGGPPVERVIPPLPNIRSSPIPPSSASDEFPPWRTSSPSSPYASSIRGPCR
jgi:hypothetical protein